MPSIIAFSPVSHAFNFLLGIFYAPVSYALQIKEIPLDQNNFLVENYLCTPYASGLLGK